MKGQRWRLIARHLGTSQDRDRQQCEPTLQTGRNLWRSLRIGAARVGTRRAGAGARARWQRTCPEGGSRPRPAPLNFTAAKCRRPARSALRAASRRQRRTPQYSDSLAGQRGLPPRSGHSASARLMPAARLAALTMVSAATALTPAEPPPSPPLRSTDRRRRSLQSPDNNQGPPRAAPVNGRSSCWFEPQRPPNRPSTSRPPPSSSTAPLTAVCFCTRHLGAGLSAPTGSCLCSVAGRVHTLLSACVHGPNLTNGGAGQ